MADSFAAPTRAGETLVVGVVADTHIPDRAASLHPELIPALRAAGVQHILHAGDLSGRRVLAALEQICPVTAALGNRDLLAGPLPLVARLALGGVQIALMHGHGGWGPYLWDKWKFLVYGYNLQRYLPRVERTAGEAQVAIFGHTHYPVNLRRNGRLLLNPGSASFGFRQGRPPTYGLLHIQGQDVSAEILPLTGWKLDDRAWVAVNGSAPKNEKPNKNDL